MAGFTFSCGTCDSKHTTSDAAFLCCNEDHSCFESACSGDHIAEPVGWLYAQGSFNVQRAEAAAKALWPEPVERFAARAVLSPWVARSQANDLPTFDRHNGATAYTTTRR